MSGLIKKVGFSIFVWVKERKKGNKEGMNELVRMLYYIQYYFPSFSYVNVSHFIYREHLIILHNTIIQYKPCEPS